MEISLKLRRAIAESPLRQYQLATLAGLHPSTLSKALNGTARLRAYDRRILAVARVLNISPDDAFDTTHPAVRLKRCVVCPSTDLFVRKDFPQRLGAAVVVIGFAVSCITWYYYLLIPTFVVLFSTVLVDVALYALVGNALVCYRCNAHYRGVEGLDRYEPFDLETHERYRQLEARLHDPATTATAPPHDT